LELKEIINEYFGEYRVSTNNNIFIRCPSPGHKDKSPSCHLDLSKKVFICFSCGAKGTLETALRWKNAPKELVEVIAETNREKNRKSPIHPEDVLDESVLYAWDREPTAWIDAGLDRDVLADHEIGFDFFNNCITIPIRNSAGELVAISARSLKNDGGPRYKIYKRELMDYCPHGYSPRVHDYVWRYHKVPPTADKIIVVEGFKACLSLVQHGYTGTVALLGKMMSDAQKGILISDGRPIYLMLDNDEAGRKGQENIAIMLSKTGTDTWIADYSTKQPDELTKNELDSSIRNAMPLLQWRRKGDP
jgi:DNA primase